MGLRADGEHREELPRARLRLRHTALAHVSINACYRIIKLGGYTTCRARSRIACTVHRTIGIMILNVDNR